MLDLDAEQASVFVVVDDHIFRDLFRIDARLLAERDIVCPFPGSSGVSYFLTGSPIVVVSRESTASSRTLVGMITTDCSARVIAKPAPSGSR
jgi:hypothetical protein